VARMFVQTAALRFVFANDFIDGFVADKEFVFSFESACYLL
jgi:hypothetical protein